MKEIYDLFGTAMVVAKVEESVTVCPRRHVSVSIKGFVYTSLSKFVDTLQALVHA